MKLQKALAVIGAGVLLFAATDAITYAATGSSLVLGKINQANATTTIQNTGTAPALRLLTKSTATAPLIVNGKGRVTNLYADRAATADNAAKVGGQTLAQVNSAATSHLSWANVHGDTVIGRSLDVTITHTALGHWCAVVAGIDVSNLNKSGFAVTPLYNWDHTGVGPLGALTHVEVAGYGNDNCAGGVTIDVFHATLTTGEAEFSDDGFSLTIIH